MQDYNSLCVAVMIWAIQVNTQTHNRQTALDRLYYLLSLTNYKCLHFQNYNYNYKTRTSANLNK